MTLVVQIPQSSVAGKMIEKIIEKEGLGNVLLEEAQDKTVHVVLKHTGKLEKSITLKIPVRMGEIMDSVRSLVRVGGEKSGTFKIGNLVFNAAMNEISGGGKSIRLTEKEGAILTLLAKEPGAVHSRESLLQTLWGYAENIETHTLESHIYRIRQKIESDPANPKIIITAETGYFLAY